MCRGSEYSPVWAIAAQRDVGFLSILAQPLLCFKSIAKAFKDVEMAKHTSVPK